MKSLLRDYTYIRTTRGMCKTCRAIVNARIIEEDHHIYQENLCPTCGATRTMVAEDRDWYFQHIPSMGKRTPPKITQTGSSRGCPHDCGLCARHVSAPILPVFSITNACNLQCPICFTYNRNDKRYDMSLSEMKSTMDFLFRNRDDYDLINITGGEPTLHPQLMDLLEIARDERIGRITVNSNGLRLARDESLVRALRDLGVYVILSFDTLARDTSMKIHGRDLVDLKLQALQNLERYAVGTTLLNVMIAGVNDGEIMAIVDLAQRFGNIRSITIQTMTFTGQGGRTFAPHRRTTLDMAMRIMEDQSGGVIRRDHFFAMPANHPLCYSIAYYFKTDAGLRSFTDILDKEDLIALVGPHYLIHPDDKLERALQTAIARSWAHDAHAETLAAIRKLLKRMYPGDRHLSPFDRQRVAEESILTIYIHAHMDEENLDLSRLVCCTDLVPVDGKRFIPACAYNLFYRMHDRRFWKAAQDG